ncbi:conserved hypothetical protein, partial [Ixodes scapularis]
LCLHSQSYPSPKLRPPTPAPPPSRPSIRRLCLPSRVPPSPRPQPPPSRWAPPPLRCKWCQRPRSSPPTQLARSRSRVAPTFHWPALRCRVATSQPRHPSFRC